MAREFCKICVDPRLRDLEKLLRRGAPLRVVAHLAALPKSSLYRHWANRLEHEKRRRGDKGEILHHLLADYTRQVSL